MYAEKARLRKQIRQLVQDLPEAYITESDQGILDVLAALPQFQAAKQVFAYISVGRESDTRRLLTLCLQLGKQVALPRCYGAGHMEAVCIDQLDGLQPGRYGIPEPPEDGRRMVLKKTDIIFVPGLAFDPAGYRLGQGGGYYDRFLSTHQAVTVGLCRAHCLLDSLPREPHDFPVHIVVTEKGIAGLA